MIGPATLVALTLAVQVTGGSACPTPSDVVDRLAPLVPAHGSADTSPWSARVERDDDVMSIELVDMDGTVLATRQLGATASCAELAGAAAVVVATWEVELRARGSLGLGFDEPAVQLGLAPARFELGLIAGLFGNWSGRSTVPAGQIELSGGRGPWGAATTFAVAGEHDLLVGAGHARWRRMSWGLGPRWSFRSAGWDLTATTQALLGWLSLRGTGFDRDRHDDALDLGASAGIRVGAKRPGISPWVGVTLNWWPLPRDVLVVGDVAGDRLPQVEALVGGGVSFTVHR